MKNDKTNNILFVILILVMGAFYYNTIKWLIISWIYNPYYSNGFVVILLSGYMIWGLRKEVHKIEMKQSQMGLIFLIIGMILYFIASIWTIRFLSGFSLILTIYGGILFLYGWEFTKKISFPILFLLLAIPVPFLDLATPPTQQISAVSSSGLANFIGIPVQREGLVLTMHTGKFEVGTECSGLFSIISLLTTAIIFAYILEGSLIAKLSIVISSIPLALAGNILRITSILAVANRYGHDVAMNYFHDFSDILLFSTVLIGLFIVGRSFGRLKFKNIF